MTSAKKTAAYGAVRALLEHEQLVLPRHPDLLRPRWTWFPAPGPGPLPYGEGKFIQGECGFTRIEAESAAVHDDVADALALAMGPYTAAARLRCELLRHSTATPSAGALARA